MTMTGHGIRHMTGARPLGATAQGERIGQSFQVKKTGLYHALAVPCQTIGAPTDGLRAYIESDYGGLPAYCLRGQPLYTTEFEGTTGDSLRTFDSRWFVDNGALAISNNTLINSTPGTLTYASIETGTQNMIVEADITIPALPTAVYPQDWYVGLIARHLKDVQTYLEVRILYQDNSPEIELWAIVGGDAYKADGTRNGTDDILAHNSMLPDTFVPGTTHRLRLIVNGNTVSAYLDDATAPQYDAGITPDTWIEGTPPNGWITATVTGAGITMLANMGTRAGVVQATSTVRAGIWNNFSVYSSEVVNVSNTVSATYIPSALDYVTFLFPTGVLLETDTTYHWYLDRTSSNSATDHYAVGVDTNGGYADGHAERWNSTWVYASGTHNQAAPYWRVLTGEDCCFLLSDVPMSLASPTAATVTKATARELVARAARDWAQLTTSGAGNVGGTTVVASSLIGFGDDYFNGEWWPLQTSGANAGQWRRTDDFASSSGTLTVVPAFGAQVASGVTLELHNINPGLYTTAMNLASRDAYPVVCRSLLAFVATVEGQEWYRTPLEFREVTRVFVLDGDGRTTELGDWQPSADGKTFRVGATGWGNLGHDRVLLLEGRAALSLFTEDTTLFSSGTVASDSTATLEIATASDPWRVWQQYAVAHLYDLMGQEAAGGAPEDRERWAARAQAEMQKAVAMRGKNGVRQPSRALGYPQ